MRRLAVVTVAVLLIACTQREPTTGPSSSPPTPSGSVSTSESSSPQLGSWLEYGGGPDRRGVAPDSVKLGRVRKIWTTPKLDAAIYAQPLISESHVIVATERNSVYSFDAGTGRQEWRAQLGAPVRGSSLPCGNVDPSGITGTPLISNATIFVVAFLRAGPRHELFALDLESGRVAWHRGIDPPGLSARVEQQRGALALLGNRVYVPFGGLYGDCGEYKGAVVSSRTDGTGALESFIVPTSREAGIWNPAGPVSDGTNLWVTTGNSESSGAFDFGNAVIKLSARLKVLDHFAPRNWASLNAGDIDLGSLGPVIFPTGRVVAVGKAGVAYLLDASHLGGIGGQLRSERICGGAFGTAATIAGNPIYIPCDDALVGLRVVGGMLDVMRSTGGGTGPPIITGDAVWSIGYDGVLRAFSIALDEIRFGVALGDPVSRFVAPASANGRVFAPARDRLIAFALR